MGKLSIKNVTIGEDAPKIVVPLIGMTEEHILQEAELVKTFAPDIVEWRADLYEDVDDLDAVMAIVPKLRTIFDDELLLFTFRSHKEGGSKEIDEAYYTEMNQAVIGTGSIDLVDVELFNQEQVVKAIVSEAKANDVSVIMSNHDFVQTPSKEEIIVRLRKMLEYGADLPKIAVMPNSVGDVLALLEATSVMKQESDAPIVTMSMGKLGLISRLSGELLGSSLTFGSVQAASAPGQIPIDELRTVLNIIHKNMKD